MKARTQSTSRYPWAPSGVLTKEHVEAVAAISKRGVSTADELAADRQISVRFANAILEDLREGDLIHAT
jgi:transcription initiation factor IIE alpha subunit